MPYNFVDDIFHTKILCSRLSSRKVRFYLENGRSAFLSPLWQLEVTYDVHLRLIGKRVVEFLVMLIELFSLAVRLRRYERVSSRSSRTVFLRQLSFLH